MNMRRIASMITAGVLLFSVGACSNANTTTTPPTSSSEAPATSSASTDSQAPVDSAPAADSYLSSLGLDSDLRFTETRNITVEVYDRANTGGSDPADNYYANYIKEGMLRDHNVNVTFVKVPRWTEGEEMNNLLASNSAPDVSVTYSKPTIDTYGIMGGVVDVSSYVNDNKEILPNFWGLLGDRNINWNKDPVDGHIWALEALLFNNLRTNTFVREDWLKTLNIAEPTTLDEFTAMLQAFKDNAETLLGANDASKIVPFQICEDVGYHIESIVNSYIPNDISQRDYYIHRFDDRQLFMPGINNVNALKSATAVVNKWYNDGLVWKDFALYKAGDQPIDDILKSGVCGAFIGNWDYPYRNGDDSISTALHELVGPDANFMAVSSFKNDAGISKSFLSGPIDRKVFLPSTNKEIIASLLYLDWLSTLENRRFLQIGDEGVTHEKFSDGSIKTIPATGDKIMNSPNNIDYTIVINGLDLGDPDLNLKSLTNNYTGVEPYLIEKAYNATKLNARIDGNVQVGLIDSEEGQGPALTAKRDALLDNAIVAPVDQFDAVYDSGYQDCLNSCGQAIIDERTEKWEKFFGSATELPQ